MVASILGQKKCVSLSACELWSLCVEIKCYDSRGSVKSVNPGSPVLCRKCFLLRQLFGPRCSQSTFVT